MQIITIAFEEPFIININEQSVRLVVAPTQEHGNIKFTIQAPRTLNVNREEIYLAIKKKTQTCDQQET